MGRRELREHIFRILFQLNYYSADALPEQADMYIDGIEDISAEDAAYIRDKAMRIVQMSDQLDAMISEKVTGWSLKRMGRVDLTLLRLALYEMKFDDDIPEHVAINEAVELAKKYGEEDSRSFVNGVLARLASK